MKKFSQCLFLNTRGFSLIEMLVATGIFGIAVLIGTGIIKLTQSQFQATKTTMTTETSVASFINQLSTTVRLGVKISDTDLDPGNMNSNGEGRFRKSFQFSKLSDSPAAIQPLAYFLRESSFSNPSNASNLSTWRATGLFFRPPTATVPGRLYLSLNARTGTVDISPRDSDMHIEGITELSLSEAKSLNSKLKSIKLSFRYRIPMGVNDPKITMWCPQADIVAKTPGCSGSPGKDVYREIVLFFSNNKLNHIIRSADYLNGAYFFRPRVNN